MNFGWVARLRPDRVPKEDTAQTIPLRSDTESSSAQVSQHDVWQESHTNVMLRSIAKLWICSIFLRIDSLNLILSGFRWVALE